MFSDKHKLNPYQTAKCDMIYQLGNKWTHGFIFQISTLQFLYFFNNSNFKSRYFLLWTSVCTDYMVLREAIQLTTTLCTGLTLFLVVCGSAWVSFNTPEINRRSSVNTQLQQKPMEKPLPVLMYVRFFVCMFVGLFAL